MEERYEGLTVQIRVEFSEIYPRRKLSVPRKSSKSTLIDKHGP